MVGSLAMCVEVTSAFAQVRDPIREIDGVVETGTGVELTHTLYLPPLPAESAHGEGKFPVLLVRTPYGRALTRSIARREAERGRAVLVQDCRGTGGSGTGFIPFVHEAEDGADTLQWLHGQSWFDGRLATYGMSYLGITQHFLLAAEPDPQAMVLQFTSGDVYHDLIHFGGGQSLAIALHWGLMMQQSLAPPQFDHLPLIEADDASGADVAYWNDWTNHASFDEYWQALDVRDAQRTARSAVLSIGGWYDLFLPGQVADYQRFAAREGPVEETFARLILGPWDHGGPGEGRGRPDLGPEAYGSTEAEERAFLARFLDGESNGYEQRAGVRAFFLGENRWHEFDRWPPTAAQQTSLYLRGLGNAERVPSDGLLTAQPPSRAEPADRYVYDPDDPTPSFASSLWSPLSSLREPSTIAAREDVLLYATPPLRSARRFAGSIRAQLFARADAEDVDFCVRVVDLAPDGSSEWRGEGHLRARYRKGFEQPVLLERGAVAEIDVDAGPMAFVVPRGHRIGIQIASANFPRFARHPGTAGDPGTTAETTPVAVEVLHDPEHPSRLLLWELPAEVE